MTALSAAPAYRSARIASAADLAALKGSQEPRIGTPRLPGTSSRLRELQILDSVFGSPLLPWQAASLEVALEVGDGGRWTRQLVAFVVARQNGKSEVLKRRILGGLLLFDDELVLHTAADRALPRSMFEEIAQIVEDDPELRKLREKVRFANGQEQLTIRSLASGRRNTYRVLAPTGTAFRGYAGVGLLVIDEIREHRDAEALSAARYTQRAHRDPQLWVASNAGTDLSVPLNEIRDRGRAAAQRISDDPSVAYFEFSAPADAELDDLDAWEQANPSLGHFLRGSTLLEELRSDEPQRFATEALCVWRSTDTVQAISWAAWQACQRDELPAVDPTRDPVWLGVDVDPEHRAASIVALSWVGDELLVQLAGSWTAPEGETVTEAEVADRLEELATSYAARAIAYDPYTCGGIVDRLEGRSFPFVRVSGADYVIACAQLEDAVLSGQLIHAGQAELDRALASAGRRTVNDGSWTISRLRSGRDPIAAVVALARGVHVAVRPGSGAAIVIL